MNKIDSSRRRFSGALGSASTLAVLGAGGAFGLSGRALAASTGNGVASGGAPGNASGNVQAAAPAIVRGNAPLGRVLVVGGGYGGATAARYLRRWGGPGIEVTLVEREAAFVSCPLSNLVLGGSADLADLTLPYSGLEQAGITVLQDEVIAIDPVTRQARFGRAPSQRFDRIVVSPGVDLNFAAVQGFDADARKTILHAWKAGPQTLALRRQLEEMPDGGVYVLAIPLAPYRCPPGPYERVCQVAHYFKTAKPRSKIIVLDANPDITSKKALFLGEWNGQYKGLIDYQPNMKVTELDAATRTAITELGDRISADVLNLVPPMGAARIVRDTGLINANNRWCDVDWVTMESTAAPGIHVLGDATLSAPAMPKSGHMANQHGKAVAAAIVEILNGRTPGLPTMANTCYSFVDDKRVMHVSSVHQYSFDKMTLVPVQGAGGVSDAASELEGSYARSWARNIWNDMLG
jgi:sulfide dehydrogenase [flavocytochrome c] flavoprotein subunit